MSRQTFLLALAATFMTYACDGAPFHYYVAPNGSDTAAGSSTSPWLTLQHAANVVGAGDLVTVRAGNYVGFNLTKSGSATAPIEFDADPGVTIFQRNATTPDGINLENASNIIIDGFSVNAMPRAGVRSVGQDGTHFATAVTIRDVHATNNGNWGIFTGFVNNLLIENNVTSGSVNEHGIYVSNSGDSPVIRNNISFDNHANGIHMNGDLSQGGDGIISGAVVSGNIIYNNGVGGGSGINMDGVTNSRVENNLLYNNHASGISLYQIDGGSGSVNNVVVNNTVYEASDARWAINIQDASTGNKVFDNILISLHPRNGAINISPDSLTSFASDYNAVIDRFTLDDGGSVQTLAQWRTATGQDAHSFVASAASLFVNAGANDYHLSSTSPAKNAGTSQLATKPAPPADLEGRPRPAGSAYDIGAYEFGALFGDFNRDGIVNGADYVLWRKTLGAQVTRFAGADGDGNGTIDQNDFARWRMNVGAISGSGTAIGPSIPEPENLAALCLALALASALCRFHFR
jgi:hypothetical protein